MARPRGARKAARGGAMARAAARGVSLLVGSDRRLGGVGGGQRTQAALRLAAALRECAQGGPADSSGEEVGKGEEVAAELTVGSIWAEKSRERELDGEGRSSAERQWRTAVCGLDSAGGGLNRARGGAEEVRGEVKRLRV